MKRRVLTLLTAIGVAVPLVAVAASPAHADFYSNRYQIVSYNSAKCVDVVNGSGSGARIQQWDCEPGTWQQEWGFNYIESQGSLPQFKIAPRHTDYLTCLDALNGGTSWGTPIQHYPCSAHTRQQRWIQEHRFTDAFGVRWYRYRSYNAPGLCLDVSGVSIYNGAQLQLWGCHNGNNQLFANFNLGPRYP